MLDPTLQLVEDAKKAGLPHGISDEAVKLAQARQDANDEKRQP